VQRLLGKFSTTFLAYDCIVLWILHLRCFSPLACAVVFLPERCALELRFAHVTAGSIVRPQFPFWTARWDHAPGDRKKNKEEEFGWLVLHWPPATTIHAVSCDTVLRVWAYSVLAH
jgi:hypothetical protein